MEAVDYIPRENFNLWYSLFKQSSGRLLGNPIDGRRVYVSYKFDDMGSYNDLQQSYRRLTTPIIEKRRGAWKRVRMLCKYFLQLRRES